MDRKMHVRNFGLKNRDVAYALSNAYQLSANSFKSNATAQSAFNAFKSHLKENGINDLRNVTKEHVISFAQSLENKSASTLHNYVSFVNTAMANARLDKQCYIDLKNELPHLESRTAIATTDKSISEEQHANTLESLSERLSCQITLQRELGLRFKESCLIDAHSALKQALKSNSVTISLGTKGGRERTLPITHSSQISALKQAALIQGHDHSLIPHHQSFKTYQTEAYNHIKHTGINFHGERHTYANKRYEALTHVKSPIQANVPHSERFQYIAKQLNVSLTKAKEIDHQARLQVAKELGHGRVVVTNNYLG